MDPVGSRVSAAESRLACVLLPPTSPFFTEQSRRQGDGEPQAKATREAKPVQVLRSEVCTQVCTHMNTHACLASAALDLG